MIALRPDNSEAYYDRGLLYQSQGQHQFAIDDFSTAIGLTPQKRGAIRGTRAVSISRSTTTSRRPSDLDRAVQLNSSDPQAWASRGLAYERPGQKDKAAGSYAKALNINNKYQPAVAGFARVGGEVGKAYQTF